MRLSALNALLAFGLSAAGRNEVLLELLSGSYLPDCHPLANAVPGRTGVVVQAMIAISYVVICGYLLWVRGKLRRVAALRAPLQILHRFAVIVIACATIHATAVMTFWLPLYPLAAILNVSYAVILAAAAISFAKAAPTIMEKCLEFFETDGATARTFRNSAGHPTKMLETHVETTGSKEAEESLQNQANLLDLSSDAIVVRDASGIICFWNRGAEEMLGFKKHEAIGQISHQLLQTSFPLPLTDIEATLVQKGRWEGEIEYTRTSGQRIVVASRWVLQRKVDGPTFNVLEINTDITDRRKAEEASQSAKRDAENANRAKSDFLANMSHEIRTPMNAIMGMTHLALRSAPTPEQRIYLEKTARAADSLLNIINDILDFSKMEAGKMELESMTFSVGKVMLDLKDIVSHAAKRGSIALEFSIAEEVPAFLIGDPFRLGQILINLVNNGIKFTREGSVSIDVSASDTLTGKASISFAVTDTGIGMSPGQLDKLFMSFNQADPSVTRRVGGTGLGLAISKHLCKLMNGDLAVTSKEGVGSTFLLTVPFVVATGHQRPLANDVSPIASRSFILVVDDSADARDVMVAMLSANGFASEAVESGEEVLQALKTAATSGRPFDLILMDWRMSGIDGVETTRQIKAHSEFSRVPCIVMVTAFEREQVMNGVLDPGLEGFLVKPIAESLLVETISVLLNPCKQTGDEASHEALHPSSIGLEGLSGRRVLLVEDNEINRDLATELLADLGVLVSVAVDGQEGVNRITAEPFDLVLMDIQMPVMDGLTATRQVRADPRFAELPIIAMTAHAMNGDREKSLESGMNDHLTKPIRSDTLRGSLLRWMPARPLQAMSSPVLLTKTPSDGIPRIIRADWADFPEELPPFNLKAALARTNGKPTLLRKMLLMFHNQYGEAGTTLREHVSHGRLLEAERLAHSLKGTAATLDAVDLTLAASRVEQALRSGHEEELSDLIKNMESALHPAIAAAGLLERRTMPIAEACESDTAPTSPSRNRILLIDDQAINFQLLAATFGSEYQVLWAPDGTVALEMAKREMPDLILLDIIMPGMDGYEVCRNLRSNAQTSDIPIIFLTGAEGPESEAKGVALGAVDYIIRPCDPAVARARVKNQIMLKREREKHVKVAVEEHAIAIDKEVRRSAELQENNRQELKLKDDFLSHVSHELRSPLTSIYSFTTILADGLAGETNTEQKRYLDIILKNVGQLRAMVEDLLDVTQARTGKLSIELQCVAIEDVVIDALHTLQASAEAKNISISSDLEKGLRAALGDPTRVLQILIILLDNAVKFTRQEGTINVQVKAWGGDPDFVLFQVSDTGCGIPLEKTESIFQHLYQIAETDQAGRKGLGLGLHIAKELVERQGGAIWVNSDIGHGSQFLFTLPAWKGTTYPIVVPNNSK